MTLSIILVDAPVFKSIFTGRLLICTFTIGAFELSLVKAKKNSSTLGGRDSEGGGSPSCSAMRQCTGADNKLLFCGVVFFEL